MMSTPHSGTHSAANSHGSYAACISDVSFTYDHGSSWALSHISLDIPCGDYVCITGDNGSGKSTLARILAGLAAPDEGTIHLLGEIVFDHQGAHPHAYRAARRNIGAVFQNPEDQIVSTIVHDDIAFGPENLALEPAQIRQRITQALAATSMEHHRFSNPTKLSGGQQQRIAIAGMLAMHPRILVLDEPTAMLDQSSRADILRILDHLHSQGITIVHITHREDEIQRAQRVIRLCNGSIESDAYAHRTSAASSIASTGTERGACTKRDAINAAHEGTHKTHVPAGIETGIKISAASTSRASATLEHPHPAPALELRHISYRYPGTARDAVHDISFTVHQGEILALCGSNGSGKTTLTRLICALNQPTSGEITIQGMPLHRLHRRERIKIRQILGLVMQKPERQLFAETVEKDVAFGPQNQGLSKEEVHERVYTALRMLHIEHLAQHSPFQLSGGQQRLVAIAGVLACAPRVLVLDEPTMGLDLKARTAIYSLLSTLKNQGVAIVLITHSPHEIKHIADRAIVLTPEGTLHQEDTSDLPQSPLLGMHSHTPNHSWLAHIDARVKVCGFLALMFSSFAIAAPWQLIAGICACSILLFLGRISIGALLRGTRVFLFMFLCIGILNLIVVRSGTPLIYIGSWPITDHGLLTAILYTCRFALVIIFSVIFLSTTTYNAITDALERLLAFTQSFGMHPQEIALVLSLAMRFIPTLTMETRSIIQAQSARGGSIETGHLMQRVKALSAIIVPIFSSALRHADTLACALDARCYEAGIKRTHVRIMRIGWRDGVFALLVLVYLSFVIIPAFF